MKVIRSVWALCLAVLVCVSCSRDPGPTAPASAPDKSSVSDYRVDCDPELHEECEFLLADDTLLTMLDTVVTFDCRVGVTIDATPEGWDSEHEVILTIAAGAVDSAQAESLGQPYPDITLTISIPYDYAGPPYTPGDGAPFVPFDFDPHGLEFDPPADLRVCWPEWAGTFVPTGAFLSHVDTTYVMTELHYTLVRKEFPVLGEKDSQLDIDTECDFHIPHFSRWGVENGTKPPGGSPPPPDGGDPGNGGHTDKTDYNPDFEYPRDYIFYAVTQTPDSSCCGTKVLIDRGGRTQD